MTNLGNFGNCGCCKCNDCCNGAAPLEFDVSLTVVDADCTYCAAMLTNLYTVRRSPTDRYGPCRWQYGDYPGIPCTSGCSDTFTCPFLANVAVELQIYCRTATTYGVSVQLWLWLRDYSTDPDDCNAGVGVNDFLNVFTWGTTVPVADFDCTTIAGFELPFLHRRCWCANALTIFQACPFDKWACNSTLFPTVISAVP